MAALRITAPRLDTPFYRREHDAPMIEIKRCQAVRDTPPHEAKAKDGEGAALLTSFTIAVMAAGY